MRTKLLLLTLCISAFGFSQVQPTVHNATFDKILKDGSTSPCACTGWINKDLADQAESSDINSNDVVKLDDFESDGIYQEIAVVAGSTYTLDLEYTFKIDPTTTQSIEVYVLKSSGYESGYDPNDNYVTDPATSPQSGYGYTLATIGTAANQYAMTTIVPPGDTDTHNMTQISFTTEVGETSLALFVRAVGPYNTATHGDVTKDKGWMNGDAEIRMDNLALVNTTALSTKDVLASQFNIYPNPAQNYIQIDAKDIKISSVEMYSLIGQKVISGKSLVNSRLDISRLNSGIYLLKVNSENGSLTKKIIVD